eukprot:790368-Pyramimonas_sp.AAC.1
MSSSLNKEINALTRVRNLGNQRRECTPVRISTSTLRRHPGIVSDRGDKKFFSGNLVTVPHHRKHIWQRVAHLGYHIFRAHVTHDAANSVAKPPHGVHGASER